MEKTLIILTVVLWFSCSPKGPQTYDNYMVGKTEAELIEARGEANEVKNYTNAKVFIYKKRHEYFGKKDPSKQGKKKVTPKKIIQEEQIYYINDEGVIYKFQVWNKRID